jgi:hypothetical protein
MARILNKWRVIFILIWRVQTQSDGQHLSSSRWRLLHTESLERKHGRRVGAPILNLRCSDLDMVSSYGIATMRCNYFANLWQWRWSTSSWRRRHTSSEAWCRWEWILVRLRLRGPSLRRRWASGQLLQRPGQCGRQRSSGARAWLELYVREVESNSYQRWIRR